MAYTHPSGNIVHPMDRHQPRPEPSATSTKTELIAYAQAHNLPTDGTKADLWARIVGYLNETAEAAQSADG